MSVSTERSAGELIDLKEIDLPLLDEPTHPCLHDYRKEHSRTWSYGGVSGGTRGVQMAKQIITATIMLDELARWTSALGVLRQS